MGITYKRNNVLGRRLPKQTVYPVTIGNGVTNWGRFNATQEVITERIFSRQTVNTNSLSLIDSAVGSDGVVHIIYRNSISPFSLNYTNNGGIGGTWITPVVIIPATATSFSASILMGNETPTPYVSIMVVYAAQTPITLHYRLHNALPAAPFTTETIYSPPAPASKSYNYPRMSITSTGLLRVTFTRDGTGANDRAVYYTARSAMLPAAPVWSAIADILPLAAGNDRDSCIVMSTTNTPYVVIANTTGYEIHNAISSPTTPIAITYSTTFTNKIVPGGRHVAIMDSSDKIHILIDDQANDQLLISTVVDIAGTPTESSVSILSYSNSSTQILPTISLNTVTQKLHVTAVEGIGNLYYINNESGSFVSRLVDASAFTGTTTGLKPSISHINDRVNILYYDNVSNLTTAPRLLFSSMTPTLSRKYTISDAINNAISSLPNGGQIEILSGDYYLDNTTTVVTDNIQLIGNGTTISMDPTQNSLKVSADGVTIKNLKLQNINPITYTIAAQNNVEPMLELVPSLSSSCTVELVTFSGINADSVEKDIEWTIADGHLVNNNISTTKVSGLGGI